MSVCVLGRVLEERCVCVALGKEGSCSFNGRASACPQNLDVLFCFVFLFFKYDVGLVQGV